ncbi:Copper transporter 5.1 like [Actinidia chinensis var. chinensis]|uniref:Copper transport protein n=1 Tax=Actinidia chinensis var. chinensis TaxID=1590841 RepID=A0A2R6Q3B9_ACTCC|nr:Copper transporter 5.1 like [Actinidia chinensis var. chinensis]
MMHMTFYWGRQVTLLLDSWKTKTWTEYALTLCACFVVSVFYQYMEDRRLRFRLLSSSSAAASPPPSSVATPLLYPKSAASPWSPARFAGAVLFGLNSAIGYLLMLAIMSFNGGVFIAVIVGLAIGYLLFRSTDQDIVVDNPCACA